MGDAADEPRSWLSTRYPAFVYMLERIDCTYVHGCRYPYEYTVLFMKLRLSSMARGLVEFTKIFRTKTRPEDLCAREIPNTAWSDIIFACARHL